MASFEQTIATVAIGAGIGACAAFRLRTVGGHIDPNTAAAAGGAASAAHALLEKWLSREWIPSIETYPAVFNIDEAYAIHAAMAYDPLVGKLGGVAGYKMGGLGQIDGVAAAYGPLFGIGIVDAPGGLSMSQLNLFNLEVEIGFIMGRTLEPRDGNADGGMG